MYIIHAEALNKFRFDCSNGIGHGCFCKVCVSLVTHTDIEDTTIAHEMLYSLNSLARYEPQIA